MSHYYFQHEEMEVFVRQSRLIEAMEFVRAIIDAFAGSRIPLPGGSLRSYASSGLPRNWKRCAAPSFFTIRSFPSHPPRGSADLDGELDAEPYFSISFFTYDPPAGPRPLLRAVLVPCPQLKSSVRSAPALGQTFSVAIRRYRAALSGDGEIPDAMHAERPERRVSQYLYRARPQPPTEGIGAWNARCEFLEDAERGHMSAAFKSLAALALAIALLAPNPAFAQSNLSPGFAAG